MLVSGQSMIVIYDSRIVGTDFKFPASSTLESSIIGLSTDVLIILNQAQTPFGIGTTI